MSREILVCSTGAVTAAGTGVDALHKALAAGDWRPEPGLERPDAPPLRVVTCREFSPKGVLPPMVARRLDRPARMLAVAAREALAPLGGASPWPQARVAITAGTWTAGIGAVVEVLRTVFLASPDEAPPAEFPSTVANAAASQLGILEHVGGPNLTFAEKQVGGLRAVLEGARMLDYGRADAVLATGVDEANWLNAEGYERIRSLAGPGRAGMLMGEGVALLVLTSAPVGLPLARLLGWGSASECAPPHLYPTSSEALRSACAQALGRGGVSPSHVDLVVSCANGIPALDALERDALGSLLGGHRPMALAVADRLGEGAYSAALRVLLAAELLAGRTGAAWEPPGHLSGLGYARCATRPRLALVTGQAAGGSAIAVVLSSL